MQPGKSTEQWQERLKHRGGGYLRAAKCLATNLVVANPVEIAEVVKLVRLHGDIIRLHGKGHIIQFRKLNTDHSPS
jgi:hypothetical protein